METSKINGALSAYRNSKMLFENQLHALKDLEKLVLLRKQNLLKHLKSMRASVAIFEKEQKGSEFDVSFLKETTKTINEFENILLT